MAPQAPLERKVGSSLSAKIAINAEGNELSEDSGQYRYLINIALLINKIGLRLIAQQIFFKAILNDFSRDKNIY